MEMYNNLKNRPYQINENGIDEFGVDHSKFSIREALEYNKKMLQENQSILPSSDNTFNSNPTNVYNNGIQYAQNNLNNTANDGNIENNQIDYSLYGNGFSKEFIDEINNDARFQQIMNNKVFPNEGGYVNNPNDPGKETNFGISSLWYPNENIKELTPERASAIYYRDYWKNTNINKLPSEIADIVFDNSILQGQPTAIKNLQNVIGVEQDGLIGSNTLNALKNINYQTFKNKFISNAHKIESQNIKNKPNQSIFEKGHRKRFDSYY